MLFGFSLRLGDFLHILTSKMHLQNHLNIWLLELSRRFVIDLVLQGRIWMDSDWPGLDFSLIWDRFWLYFQMEWTYLLQTMAGWTICINCCTQHRNLLSHWLFSMTSGAAGCAPRLESFQSHSKIHVKKNAKKVCQMSAKSPQNRKNPFVQSGTPLAFSLSSRRHDLKS